MQYYIDRARYGIYRTPTDAQQNKTSVYRTQNKQIEQSKWLQNTEETDRTRQVVVEHRIHRQNKTNGYRTQNTQIDKIPI